MASAKMTEDDFVTLEMYKTLDVLPYTPPSHETKTFIAKAEVDLPKWHANGSDEIPKHCILHLLSKLQFVLQQDEEAIDSINKAISLQPNFSVHYTQKGLLLATIGDLDNAVQSTVKATQINPNRAKNWFDLGKIYETMKNYPKAIEAHEKAAQVDPKYAKAHYQIATLSLSSNNPNKTDVAIQHFKNALEAQPDYVDAHFNLGQIYQNHNQTEEAIPHFQKVIELSPRDWSAKGKLIQLYQQKGDLQARDQVRTALLDQWKLGQVTNSNRYCRDQFDWEGFHYFVYEYFTLAGQNGFGVRYNFMATKNDKIVFRYSFGSYDSTNAIHKEMQPTAFKPNDDSESNRAYHLDGYFDGGKHVTYGMYIGELGYDQVKEEVMAILKGQKGAISSSVSH